MEPLGPDEAVPGNWGRWGVDDERGTLNLLTPEKILAAASLIVAGVTYPLGLQISTKRSLAHAGRPKPMHFMTLDGGDFAAGVQLHGGSEYADDYLMLPCHGTTHVDALAHYWSERRLYNGFSSDRVRSYGATRCGIEHVGSIVSRGVLLDVARHHGVDYLPLGHCITVEEIEAVLRHKSTAISAGDCVLVRTGWPTIFDRDPDEYHRGAPGIGVAAAQWLADRDVCAVGADTVAVEVHGADDRYDGGSVAPSVHPLLIRDYGIYLLEMLDLEALAADGVVEFLFVLAPLQIVGGTASPVNPLAIA